MGLAQFDHIPVLASRGEFGEIRASLSVTFEEKAGVVPITIREAQGKITSCELAALQSLSLGKTVSAQLRLPQSLSLRRTS
jgi:hypothetical protein